MSLPFACVLCRTGCAGSVQASTVNAVIGTYYGSWFSGPPYALQPEDINAARFTHVYYAFVLVSATNYTIQLGSPSMDSVLIPQFTASLTARNPCLVPMLSVGGASFGGAVWSAMANQQSRRAAFISSAIAFCREHGFGGVDLVSVRTLLSLDRESDESDE